MLIHCIRKKLAPPAFPRGCTYERHGDFFIKAGPRVEAAEVAALKMIQERLHISVPRMHGHHISSNTVTITMDFVDGETLWDIWQNLSTDQKSNIASQLRAIVDAMRSLKADLSMIGSCDGGQALDLRVYDTYRGGPFTNEEAFNNWLMAGTLDATPSNLLQEFRKRLRKDHRIVLTHGDFAQQNIIVKNGKVVALVDWQCAGWFPEYWDFIKFFARPARSKDWYQYANEIFSESYFDELFLYQFLSRYQQP